MQEENIFSNFSVLSSCNDYLIKPIIFNTSFFLACVNVIIYIKYIVF